MSRAPVLAKAPRRWHAPILALAATLAGCEGSEPQPLELVGVDPFGDPASLVAGGGTSTTVGYTSGASAMPTLRLVRHDAAAPDRTVLLADVSFVGGGISRLIVTDEVAALVAGGVVRILDLSGSPLVIEDLPALGLATDVVVAGRWVLATAGSGLALVSRDAPDDVSFRVLAGTPTALLAVQGRFLVFTTAGYAVVDPGGAAPTVVEVSDPALAGVRVAHADGAAALVAGPAPSADRSRVLRLDLSDVVAPTVVRSHEVPGSFVSFAWDGGATSVIAIHGSGDGADPLAFHEGWVVREGAEGFRDAGVPLTLWSQGDQPFAAHADHLFAAEARGLLLLRIR